MDWQLLMFSFGVAALVTGAPAAFCVALLLRERPAPLEASAAAAVLIAYAAALLLAAA